MLFDPVKIGKVECKNRIAMAPIALCEGYRNTDGSITQRTIDYFMERAKGGVGLIITGNNNVDRESEPIHDIAFVSPASASSFGELAESVHYYGAKIFAQLSPGLGRAAPGELIDAGFKPVSSTAMPSFWRPEVYTRALTTEEIERIVRAFGNAAKILVNVGIDGVEICAHGGYLLDQFMTAVWNKRNDKYGGNLEGRLKFAIEILTSIKEKAGKDFPVSFRFSLKSYLKRSGIGAIKGEIFEEAGRDIEEGLEIARLLEKVGFDALHVDAGCWESRYWINAPHYHPHGFLVDMAEQVKKVVKIPVVTVGRINTPELAEQILIAGKSDIVALGRALWSDPYWPTKARQGKTVEIRPCIGCLDGCAYRKLEGKPMSCAVNPTVGREGRYDLRPVKARKKVSIVGGGVAGMEAARIASERGHRVMLYEKGADLGGHLLEASIPEFKSDLRDLLAWYRNQLFQAKIECRTGFEVTAKTITENKPDIVIIATGSTPIIPNIPGLNKSNIINATDLLLGKKEVGKEVVIVGGGIVGCETALWLSQKGKKVKIVEMLPQVAKDVFYANRMMLINMLALNKVEIITNTSIMDIGNGEASITYKDSTKRKIAFDSVVSAVGFKPDRALYDSLRKEIPDIYLIGDCKEPRRIMNAIWDGYFIGCAI